MTKITKKWPLAKGCSITAIALRETDGNDEWAASRNKEAKGEGANYQAELLALGIVAYWDRDGKKVASPAGEPCLAFESWNTKTRGLVLRYFEDLNGTSPKDVADFLALGEEATADGEQLAVAPPATK